MRFRRRRSFRGRRGRSRRGRVRRGRRTLRQRIGFRM